MRVCKVINHPHEARFAAEVMREIVGPDLVNEFFVGVMAAEDFSHMLTVKRGCYAFIGNGEVCWSPLLYSSRALFYTVVEPSFIQ